ncbi:hypothetical protein CI109_105658 [Kwoniella shandongensis]|uniref:Class E vacuolar protein-sorting machinery protein HSE1 n=1 Tax=Kwoniella shandongensis TaxID=1734106 RepID=A0A5M6C006_9TREE|nr:uncharacterized protein CI109_002999 [Kwoniella shandongensis]KAA5528467.1 hypothetical protein CI109_002999 [Kwoniella shandongensis]
MFSAAANPYDDLIVKATDENLASEDWALNLEVCDKVSSEGQNGARQAIGALQKRLSHRNPNVQLYALELANTLAQNCGKELLGELSSRNWTTALDRLVNDRATAAPVKKKALSYIKAWAKQFEETGDANLGLMGELYDQLRAKNLTFDEPEPAPETTEDARRRQEEEELARVLELSKQDKGGRTGFSTYQPGAGGSSSSASATTRPPQSKSQSQPQTQSYSSQNQLPPVPPEPEPEVMDINTATRVRALYTFTSAEVGELNFERGDVIKVLDRGFKEWWRGACNGRIGIFPVTYVEAIPEPSPRELQEEAQEEARVFASLGLVDQLLQTLKGIDPARGDRLDDRPEIEEMYQASVGLQGQINALIKKYSDQKAELEHMNANFLRAMRQYEELRNPPLPPAGQAQPYGYAPQAQADPYAGQYQHQQYAQQPPVQQAPQGYPQQPAAQYVPGPEPQQSTYPQQSPNGQPPQQQPSFPQPEPAYYQQQQQQRQTSTTSIQRVPTGAPGYPPQMPPRQDTEPGMAGRGAGPTAAGGGGGGGDPHAEHKAAWDAYYRQQAEQQQQQQGGYPQGQEGVQNNEYGQSPYPVHAQADGGPPTYPGQPQQQGGVDGVTSGINRMAVHGP